MASDRFCPGCGIVASSPGALEGHECDGLKIARLTAERDAARAWRTEQQTAFADPEAIARGAFEKTREAAAQRVDRLVTFEDGEEAACIRAMKFEDVFGGD